MTETYPLALLRMILWHQTQQDRFEKVDPDFSETHRKYAFAYGNALTLYEALLP